MLARGVRLIVGLVLIVALPLTVAGCGDDAPTAPSDYAPYSQIDIRVGTGDEAVTGKVLTVNYTGWFYTGATPDHKGVQFATSTLSGPAQIVLGAASVIEGWEKGLPGMRVGGIRRLTVPPSLAYGQVRYNAIPPNTTLVFDVELVSVQDATSGQ
jgi:FKBP-type peptidyl-prolyl cis-trans isomerase FkpA